MYSENRSLLPAPIIVHSKDSRSNNNKNQTDRTLLLIVPYRSSRCYFTHHYTGLVGMDHALRHFPEQILIKIFA